MIKVNVRSIILLWEFLSAIFLQYILSVCLVRKEFQRSSVGFRYSINATTDPADSACPRITPSTMPVLLAIFSMLLPSPPLPPVPAGFFTAKLRSAGAKKSHFRGPGCYSIFRRVFVRQRQRVLRFGPRNNPTEKMRNVVAIKGHRRKRATVLRRRGEAGWNEDGSSSFTLQTSSFPIPETPLLRPPVSLNQRHALLFSWIFHQRSAKLANQTRWL